MRIRNKELRARRHRKEQTIKESIRLAKAGKTAPKVEAKAVEAKPKAEPKAKVEPKAKAEAKPKAAKPKAEVEAKPKKAPAKKKDE